MEVPVCTDRTEHDVDISARRVAERLLQSLRNFDKVFVCHGRHKSMQWRSESMLLPRRLTDTLWLAEKEHDDIPWVVRRWNEENADTQNSGITSRMSSLHKRHVGREVVRCDCDTNVPPGDADNTTNAANAEKSNANNAEKSDMKKINR